MRKVSASVTCQHCRAVATVYLCPICIIQLDAMLSDLPWWIAQLEVTRIGQDRLSTGLVGKGRDPSPIRVGAMQLAAEIDATMNAWTDRLVDVGMRFLPPSCTSSHRARWMAANVETIAKQKFVGDLYSDIAALVGDPDHPDSQPGRIPLAVNKPDRLFGGLCDTVRGHNGKGEAILCNNPLYGVEAQEIVECGRCGEEVNVVRNRSKAVTDRDLMTEPKLLELLADLGEDVSRVKFYTWLKEGRLHVRGWMHQGVVVPNKIRHSDPRVFSISQCRQLRWQEEEVKA